MLSVTGTQAGLIAYPLLTLALTHSPAKAGIVQFARVAPTALLTVFSGVAADHFDRKRQMIAADAARAVAVSALAAAVATGHASFALIAGASLVEGVGANIFGAASSGALRAIVPEEQRADAANVEQARLASVRLGGAPLGGVLFGIARSIPFVVDALSYLFSLVSLTLIRARFQEERERDTATIRTRIAEGFRFLWQQPFLRTTYLLFSIGNLTIPAITLTTIVVARRDGFSSAEIGVLSLGIGVGLMLGSGASRWIRRWLSMRAILVVELWCASATLAFVAWPSVYVLFAAVLPQFFMVPSTDSVRIAYELKIIPDRMLGRVLGAGGNISALLYPLGPLAAGFMLANISARETVAVFGSISVALAVWGTLSPSLRQ
jgi:predicted MFS family arabinose efflux permease